MKQLQETERAFSRPSFLVFDRNGFSTDPAAPTTCFLLLALNYLYGGSLWSKNRCYGGSLWSKNRCYGGFTLVVENSMESHKPVETGDLLSPSYAWSKDGLRSPERIAEAVTGR